RTSNIPARGTWRRMDMDRPPASLQDQVPETDNPGGFPALGEGKRRQPRQAGRPIRWAQATSRGDHTSKGQTRTTSYGMATAPGEIGERRETNRQGAKDAKDAKKTKTTTKNTKNTKKAGPNV